MLSWASAAKAQTSGGEWQTLAFMPSERQELATAVLDGKIYVIAGYGPDGRSTDTVEVYNPATDTWASAHPLPGATNHNSAAVAAGKLYVFGVGPTRRTFVYDPANDSWSDVALTNFPHTSTAAVGVINDKIYVAGGSGANQNELEVYDPVANTWTNLPPMRVQRHHCAGGVINGKFYVVGGRPSQMASTALEVYDPQSNAWTTLSSMPTGRSGIAAGVVGGELYVFGGEGSGIFPQVEVYNPTTNTWRRIQDMPTPRHGMWASVIGNRIYLAGGSVEEGLAPGPLNEVFIVDRVATFANISSRLRVETGENVLIGGFIVTGSASKRIIVRAPGPSVPVPGDTG